MIPLSLPKKFFPYLLILSIMVTELSITLYTPTLPIMRTYFGGNEELVNLTLSLNLLGIALSGPLYGPLSDTFGRRKIFLIGMSLFMVSSFLCLLPLDLLFLVYIRFLQGLGQGVASVLSFAMIKDKFKDSKYAEAFSTIDMYIIIVPAFAPICGGYLAELHGWQLNFYVIFGSSFFSLLLLFIFLPETLSQPKRSSFSLFHLIRTYFFLFQNWSFIGNATISGLVSGGWWIFIAGAPYLLIEEFKFTVLEFSLCCAGTVLAYALGAYINNKYIFRKGLSFFLTLGVWGIFISGISLVFIALFVPMSVLSILIGTCFYMFFSAFVFPNTGVRAMLLFPQYSGFASALVVSIEIGISSLSVGLISMFYDSSFFSLALLMCTKSCVCFLLSFLLMKKNLFKLL